ncbi:mitochondrial carrier domain-containing protein [Chaetomidium leptoderma]|uniref:Mitochondrial carrier domain-containing protein n=1 Tax=Chaetomidium leptoderma TaxID=669021 RepID=A0AAN6VT78_9PEZI|nr:mitochondrial carrier domain-containing protein [Chaetomidium leptoderma]
MSADFWAGYISGAAGIILGNPLDVLKVRLQAGSPSLSSTTTAPITNPTPSTTSSYLRPFLLGTAAPVLGYGALNALLFVSYNRTEAFLNHHLSGHDQDSSSNSRGTNLLTTWLAGAVGGLATWVISTPTELVKCRAQLQLPSSFPPLSSNNNRGAPNRGETQTQTQGKVSSLTITKQILRTRGLAGLYHGGTVTALRDSIGYGFYFWGYELCSRYLLPPSSVPQSESGGAAAAAGWSETTRVLLCGGLAGIITWASIFPLDVVKTRVQTQVWETTTRIVVAGQQEGAPLLGGSGEERGRKRTEKRLGAWEVARETYRVGGVRPFFRGLAVCSVRAFIVNAVQWAVYEWIMRELGQGRRREKENVIGVGVIA